MKRIISVFLAIMLMVIGMTVNPVSAETSDFIATIGNNNTHLNPEDYDRNIKKYDSGSLTEIRSFSGWAWRNDHVNSRLDFYTKSKAFKDAELLTEDLIGPGGAVIKKENIKLTYIDLVNMNCEPYPSDRYAFDIISHKTKKDLEAQLINEAWVDIYVPADAKPGKYTTTLSLRSEGAVLAEFDYEIEVIDLLLPDPEDWQTYLDLWAYPYASNRYYSGKYNPEYFGYESDEGTTDPKPLYYIHLNKEYEAGLESELELYHQAGGNAITVSIVEDPWNSRSPCPCPSMVKWIKKADGTFEYDYTDMDYWIELNMKHGIKGQINLFSLAGVGWGFVYYNEKTGKMENDAGGYPGASSWTKISQDFLTDLAAHLEEKGWFDIAVLSMDERTYAWTKALVEVGESVTNSKGEHFKVGGAVNANEVRELYDRMYDISLWENLKTEGLEELAEERRENGLQTTLYTCGSGKMSTPNQPGEAAYAVYDSYKRNVDGVMRWALNKYDNEPILSDNHTVTYSGDCYLIYPDYRETGEMQAQSSPRFEKLCEGMRDVEKMKIIKRDYPDYVGYIEDLISSLGKNSQPVEVARMKNRIMFLSRAVLAFENDVFTDIDKDQWYMKAVHFVVSGGFMQGMSETTFAPNSPMTRAMFVTVLARLDGAELDNNAISVFDDVPSGQWYTGAIAWASKRGLVYGVSDNEFAPNATLTREQTAALIYRYAKSKKYDMTPRGDLSMFTDLDKTSEYALEPISWANAMGIINGTGPTTLDPKGFCTRAQVAQILRMFCQNVEG